jgi:hypothetical protein
MQRWLLLGLGGTVRPLIAVKLVDVVVRSSRTWSSLLTLLGEETVVKLPDGQPNRDLCAPPAWRSSIRSTLAP